MRRRFLAAVAASLILLLARGAAAEPVHNLTSMRCTTEGGTELNLEPGYHLAEPDWLRVDQEMRRLQNAETRLEAENKVLRKPDYLGVRTAVILFAFGIGTGYALFVK